MSTGLKANLDGSAAIQVGGSDAIQLSTGLAATFLGNLTLTGNPSGIVKAATVQNSTSGTAINFTDIPSTVKRISVMLNGVSTNGSGVVQIQLGTGATPTYTISGYSCYANYAGGSNSASGNTYTTGFALDGGLTVNSSFVRYGILTIDNLTSNTWLATYQSNLYNGTTYYSSTCSGSIALGGALTAVRVIGSATGNPSDTFDLGSINILYE